MNQTSKQRNFRNSHEYAFNLMNLKHHLLECKEPMLIKTYRNNTKAKKSCQIPANSATAPAITILWPQFPPRFSLSRKQFWVAHQISLQLNAAGFIYNWREQRRHFAPTHTKSPHTWGFSFLLL